MARPGLVAVTGGQGGARIPEADQGGAGTPGAELRFPARSLVLVAGLPGAGKSTLLDRLYGMRGDEARPVRAGAVRVIDSRQARTWWARYLGSGGPVPYRARVPLVYATHVWRIARAVAGGQPVVAHTRGTWRFLMYAFAWLARRSGAQLHVILLDVPPPVARRGQHARGRVLTSVAFARHVRSWRPMVDRARTGALPPAASVTVLDRAAADRLRRIRLDG